MGLGAVLSQIQDDGRIHPVAYASRALSQPETNYRITDLETLAVVWAPAPRKGIAQTDVQVAAMVTSEVSAEALLQAEPDFSALSDVNLFHEEQRKDSSIMEIIRFLEQGELPPEEKRAHKIPLQSSLFPLVDGILFFVDQKRNGQQRVVVPRHLQPKIMEEVNEDQWEPTFLEIDCSAALPVTGGRKVCLLTQLIT